MKLPAFQLARRVSQGSHPVWVIPAIGVLLAILSPCLVVDLGLIIQLLVTRDSGEVPSDWLLGYLVSGRLGTWPFFGSHEMCLLVLVGAGWLIAVVDVVLLVLLRRCAHRRALQVASDVRHKIYTQTFRLGPYDLLGTTRSRPEELFADKVELLRRGFATYWITIPASPLLWVTLLTVAAVVNVWLTLLATLLALYVLRIYRALRSREESRRAYWWQQVTAARSVLLDSLRLAPLLKGDALVEPPMAVFENALQSSGRAEMQLVRGETLLKPLVLLAVLFAAGFLLLIIGFAPHVSVAGTVLLCGAWLTAYFPFSRLDRLSSVLSEMDSAAREILFFLDRDPSVVQIPDAQPLDRLSRQIVLDHVHLADRHGRHLLTEATLTIPAGQRVVILASDTQTPLALAGLLIRFYDPAAGRVLFDDHEIGRATLDTIRGQTALVLRDGLLFPGTILQNITCGDSGFTTVQTNDALKQAGAYGFVHDLPQGLATVIGEGHTTLRADQAFRIGLARALLRAPSLLVAQEPDDGGDVEVARELDQALAQAGETRTLIILPARIHTLRTADQIYIFHDGTFHGQGNHAELLQSSELYRHLCYVRFNHYRHEVAS